MSDGDNVSDVYALEIVHQVYNSYGGLESWKSEKTTIITYTDY